MPIRALCTICSDFFDHSRDVAAIHCGHTFHLQCLIQWFETAPSRTCPQCRIQVGKRTIINKLFFDLAQEEESVLDAEFLKNELDNTRALLSQKEKEKRDGQLIIDTLRDTLEERNATVESLQEALDKAEMLCSTLKKQMKYLEQQQDETKQAREEARRLRNKMKTMERIELLLQSQRPEVEEMIRDMGVGQSAVEQLAVYCVSLKNPAPVEMLNLKLHRPAFGDDIDLNATFNVDTPPAQPSSTQHGHAKRLFPEKAHSPVQDVLKKMPKGPKQESQLLLGGQRCLGEPDEELAGAFPVFIRNAVLGQKQTKRTRAEPCRSTDAVRTGFDGLGGRTKFIQPTDTTMIRSLPVKSKPKARAKQRLGARTVLPPSQAKLDTFLW
ncbi:E3 ubiquitin-protein ligase TRAIP isoform X3 [Phocoena sinus]|uniref:E3 ubiquitin-protein ligase TRAIP isoform X3 n=1 Tax=Phocoena sinus TaxID=42100 RepID=UPI0013C4CB6E|nr:E3 ubiquitin-protein ligase TRAIP isoform X3 [Phocoena sinus]